ncbi:hypothetical protein Hoch_4251 [Haliangium ochraceum DSM 14365]|uniref:Uncharacterized protein n=1 Tax=Haliangium ochraceum (strain DSM 14365 / JCM 11303 / SMP-2) TaxID=502025 RepID=D0LL28_HALO1|nr:hypothetical protein Hoch_4251 [Haliangium ochraceum DSM 14365]
MALPATESTTQTVAPVGWRQSARQAAPPPCTRRGRTRLVKLLFSRQSLSLIGQTCAGYLPARRTVAVLTPSGSLVLGDVDRHRRSVVRGRGDRLNLNFRLQAVGTSLSRRSLSSGIHGSMMDSSLPPNLGECPGARDASAARREEWRILVVFDRRATWPLEMARDSGAGEVFQRAANSLLRTWRSGAGGSRVRASERISRHRGRKQPCGRSATGSRRDARGRADGRGRA